MAVQTSKKVAAARHHAIYGSEAIGLVVIALVLLALTIVRYWHQIHWSLR